LLQSSAEVPTSVVQSSGEKRAASQNIFCKGDSVTFSFKCWDSQLTEKITGQIDCLSTSLMNKIGWLDNNKQLDKEYTPAWYPNRDLSLTVVDSVVDSKYEEDDEMNPLLFSPIPNANILNIGTFVSVAYGFAEPTTGGLPIQENGVVMEVDLNKECTTWCKICFVRITDKKQHWFSWQKIENVELQHKRQRLSTVGK
jgi:hypothetical protein